MLISAVNYGEVYGRILRDYGADHAHSTMSALSPLPIEVLDATAQRALQAADVKHLRSSDGAVRSQQRQSLEQDGSSDNVMCGTLRVRCWKSKGRAHMPSRVPRLDLA